MLEPPFYQLLSCYSKKTLCADLRCRVGGGGAAKGEPGQKLDVNTDIVQRL